MGAKIECNYREKLNFQIINDRCKYNTKTKKRQEPKLPAFLFAPIQQLALVLPPTCEPERCQAEAKESDATRLRNLVRWATVIVALKDKEGIWAARGIVDRAVQPQTVICQNEGLCSRSLQVVKPEHETVPANARLGDRENERGEGA